MIDVVFQFFSVLGADWIILVLFMCSILALAVIIEKSFLLRHEKKEFIYLIQLVETIDKNQNNYKEKIVAHLKSQSYSGVLYKILIFVLNRVRKKDDVEMLILQENKRLKSRLVILDILGNNSVYLGLLGTVLGIMNAFSHMSRSSDPVAVMSGVSEALSTTALGLVVGLPCVIAFNILNISIRNFLLDIDCWVKKFDEV